MVKPCSSCGESFEPSRSSRKFCSRRCVQREMTRRYRARIRIKAAQGAICRWCQHSFLTHDLRRDYCSTDCAAIGTLLVKRGLLRKYGLTFDQFREMWLAQEGKCAICRQTERTERCHLLCVDHDHTTGRVRGLLCNHCNRAIGLLGDDPAVLQRALEYVDPKFLGRQFADYVIQRRGGMSVQLVPRLDGEAS